MDLVEHNLIFDSAALLQSGFFKVESYLNLSYSAEKDLLTL